jgi:hypothetical protein
MVSVIVVFLVELFGSQPNSNRESAMTTASRSLATALPMGALRERLAPPSYTTTEDTTQFGQGGRKATANRKAKNELAHPTGFRTVTFALGPTCSPFNH